MIVNARLGSDELIDKVLNTLYNPIFSKFQSEYYDPDLYRYYLKETDSNPEVHMLVYNPENPSGFLIFEAHKASKAALLTYIAIDPKERGKGIATLLFQEANKLFKELNIKACYAEVHDPELIDPANDIMNPHERLVFFEKLGAKVIPIKYVQPPLEKDAEISRNLMLLTFNQEYDMKDVYDFLYEFYQVLGIEEPENDNNFRSMFGNHD